MLSEKDKEFLIYWEKVREARKSFSVKLTSGLPFAALFCVPILLFIAVIYLFFPEWYTKISNSLQGGTTLTIVIAVIICMFFFSYFRMQYKWEMNEQLYQELKSKAAKAGLNS